VNGSRLGNFEFVVILHGLPAHLPLRRLRKRISLTGWREAQWQNRSRNGG
jgi:hypothetical protein